MSEDSIHATPHIDPTKIARKEMFEKEQVYEAVQVASEETFEAVCEEAFNPFAADKEKERFKPLEKRKEDVKQVAKDATKIIVSSKLEDSARQYQQRNPELLARSLIRLLQNLKREDSRETLLKKVQEFFTDPSLIDEAFDFLIENAEPELVAKLQAAKDDFTNTFGRQIVAGKNIALQARDFSAQGLGTPTVLRDLYRDITGNPREPPVLFDQLSKQYTFDQLKTVIAFLLHAMGSDLKSKGPSINRGELARLFTETRSLQAILGVYRFFQMRMRLITQMFKGIGEEVPKMLNFEGMAKLFIRLLEDRYPAALKIIKLAEQMGVSQNLLGQIIVISQWRDAVRNVSPRLFKMQQQKDELLNALLKTLEELEDETEEDDASS